MTAAEARIDARAGVSYVINDNGAWCWFQDERALIDPETQTLVVGSIASPDGAGGDERAGNVELTVVDLEAQTARIVVLHPRLEADDHDVPALWRRRDGRWLAVYAKHKTDDLMRWRVSVSHDPTHWGPERTLDWSGLTGGRGVTYANLHELDGRLYCFTRAVNDDQCAMVSDDDGETWSYAGKLFTRPKIGYVNGYTRYASHAGRRVDLITTDHHPRDYDNSIYHGYLAHGRLHRSDDSVLDEHALSGDAYSQEHLTRILRAGDEHAGVRLSHAWTADIRTRGDGTIAATLTARADDFPSSDEERADRWRPIADHRFLYARFTPDEGWLLHPIGRAGAGLLPHEQDYTGLATIDPHDLDTVFVSTPFDPRTDTATTRHEIYRGRTEDAGRTWRWTALTAESEVDNLRPIVVPGDERRRVVLWFRGDMSSSQHYRCEVVLHEEGRQR